MSCPRCEPSSGTRRARWLVALIVLIAGAFWLDRSGALRPAASGRPQASQPPRAGGTF